MSTQESLFDDQVNYWMVRPGRGGVIAEAMRDKNVIAIGWPEAGDLIQYANHLAIRDFLESQGSSRNAAGRAAGQLYRFVAEMRTGDVVLVPMPDHTYSLARITGDCAFQPDLIGPSYPNVRPVEWIRQTIPETELGFAMRSAMTTPNTVTSLNMWRDDIGWLLKPVREPAGMYYAPLSIECIHFKRFKAFEDYVSIPLAPITLIAGVNSGGKSTIIQSLLLARQSIITPYRSAEEHALVYDGDLVSFAYFSDLVFAKPTDPRASMHMGFTVRVPTTGVFMTMLLDEIGASQARLQPPIDDGMVDLDVRFSFDRARRIVIVNEVEIVIGLDTATIPIVLRAEPFGDSWRVTVSMFGYRGTETVDRIEFNRFIPTLRTRGRPSISPYRSIRLMFKEAFENLRSDKPRAEQRELIIETLFTAFVEPAMSALRTQLEQRLFYIGPLRSHPQRVYVRRNLTNLDVGKFGENAVQQLYDHWDDQTQFVDLPDDLDRFHPSNVQLLDRCTVGKAVAESLRMLGMEQKLKISQHGETYEAGLSLHQRPRTFASLDQVGFGISQVLPLIALGLLSPPGSLLIFEQPELHLHPRAQAGLADLLLCLARLGRRFLIETHSDHLINRLRVRAAQDVENQLEGQTNILFVRPPDNEHESASVEQAHINRYGEIDNWPGGFLAQTAIDTRQLMLAGSNKRIREKQQQAQSGNPEPGKAGEQ